MQEGWRREQEEWLQQRSLGYARDDDTGAQSLDEGTQKARGILAKMSEHSLLWRFLS